jgi:geranylgeranyl pyrophosphate synthase
VYALHQTGDRAAARALAELYTQPDLLNSSDIQTALALLDRAGARQYAEEMEAGYFRQALHSLNETGIENAAQSNLRELAASLIDRQV